MKYSHIVIKFAELFMKGKNRKDFINALFSNLKLRLKKYPNILFLKKHDRIHLEIEFLTADEIEEIKQILKDIPGIANFSFVYSCPLDVESLKETTLKLMQEETGKTFKVFTRRSNKKFELNSDEINRLVAGHILRNINLMVNIKEPEIKLQIDIQNDSCFVFTSSTKGMGGLPYATGGKSLLLLSGGIDSPVAAYEMIKRGVKIEAIHFASPPYTSNQARSKVIDISKTLSRYGFSFKLYIIHFTKIQEKIYEVCDESYAITIMRRMMYRISEKVANRYKSAALVSGESIGQVASQTLESLAVINETITMPVLRPLITKDKSEIISLAKEIGTYDISIQPFEDCCTIFTPKSPITKPRLKKAVIEESKFDYETLIDEVLETVEILEITKDYDEFQIDEDYF